MPAYKLDSKRWYFTFYLNGKKYKKTKWNGEILKTKTEALQAERECKEQLTGNHDADRITLYELYDQYVSTTKINIKNSTLKKYAEFKKYYLTLISNKK